MSKKNRRVKPGAYLSIKLANELRKLLRGMADIRESEAALLYEIIGMAIVDLSIANVTLVVTGPRPHTSHNYKMQAVREDALNFLLGDSPWFREICEVCELNPVYVQEKIMEVILTYRDEQEMAE